MKKSIYIASGFLDSQLIYILPIVTSYCQNKNINNIIFGSEVSEHILNSKIFKIFKKKINFTYLKKSKKGKVISLLNSLELQNKYFSLNSQNILNRKNFYEYQLQHAVWDIAYNNSDDHELYPSKKQIIKATVKVNSVLNNLKKNLDTKNIDTAFLSHQVYDQRAVLAYLRQKNIKIFAHANFNIHKVTKYKDNGPTFISKKVLKKVNNKIKTAVIKKYWKKVQDGKSAREETQFASKINKTTNQINQNVIMLHVFRDSPFNVLDQDRIFSDYHSWFEETLKIIKKSNEKWTVRPHPAHKKWGENSKIKINCFLKKIFGAKIPNNIDIDFNLSSNLHQLKNTKRLITFSGSSHLESACFGVKPIIISESTLQRFDRNLILKPKNFEEYKKLILTKSNSKIFKLNRSQIMSAQKALYIRDNILSFNDILKAKKIYRGASKKLRTKEFYRITKYVEKNLSYFSKLGELLSKNYDQTVTKKYIRTFK